MLANETDYLTPNAVFWIALVFIVFLVVAAIWLVVRSLRDR